jgi:hypothetical protein
MLDQALAGIVGDIGDAPIVVLADHPHQDPVRRTAVLDRDANRGGSRFAARIDLDPADLDLGARQYAPAEEGIQHRTEQHVLGKAARRAYLPAHAAREQGLVFILAQRRLGGQQARLLSPGDVDEFGDAWTAAFGVAGSRAGEQGHGPRDGQ